jgi:tetratricopeptide (TPR) repeat protein
MQLHDASWKTVKNSKNSAERLTLALRQAETAHRADPERGSYLSTFGLALYRYERYKDALEILTQAEHLNKKDQISRFEDLAFLAMTHHQLGNADQAKVFLRRLQDRMKEGDVSEESDSFLKEAEGLIAEKR